LISSSSEPLDVDARLAEMAGRALAKMPAPTAPAVSSAEYDGTVSLAMRERRARAYARTMDPAVQGEHGSEAAFIGAMKIGRGFGLPLENAVRVFRDEYNPRCSPSWSEAEILHKCKQALDDSRMSVGALLVEQATVRPAALADGPTAADPLHGLDALRRVAIVGRDRILELAARPIEYLWWGIATAAIVTMLSGDPGGGKTTLLFLLLAARLNLGSPVNVLGREVKPAPANQYVVLVEAEHSGESSARKIVQSLHLLGIDDQALGRLILVSRQAVKIGSPEWADIVRMVAAGLVSDIALDTLARVSPDAADPNSERDQAQLFGRIYEAIESAPDGVTKPSVWVAAHNRKGGGEGLSAVSGSGQRVGQVDSLLVVRAILDADQRVTSAEVTFPKLRERPDDWPGKIEYTVSKDGLIVLEGDSKSDRPADERVLEYLRHFGPMTANELRKHLELHHRQVQAAVTKLFKDKCITSVEKDVRGKMEKAFAAVDAALCRPVDGDAPF
jgi:hypothetical protein